MSAVYFGKYVKHPDEVIEIGFDFTSRLDGLSTTLTGTPTVTVTSTLSGDSDPVTKSAEAINTSDFTNQLEGAVPATIAANKGVACTFTGGTRQLDKDTEYQVVVTAQRQSDSKTLAGDATIVIPRAV